MESEDSLDTGMTGQHRMTGVLIKGVIPVAILLLGLGGALYQTGTRRTAQQRPLPREAKAVEIIEVQRTDIQTVVHAMGTVVPAQVVTLIPQVSGQVVSLSDTVVPGGLVKAGEPLLEIDPRDYELTVQQCHQAVAQAQLDLKLEQGNQTVAQAEYRLLGDRLAPQDRELVLREPHLAQVEATWQAARAALSQAELNVERCRIKAPFNGIIREKQVDRGATVSSSTPLLTLIGADVCWIEVTVRGDELKWIQVPKDTAVEGPSVRVYDKSQWAPDVYREGSVIRLLPDLEVEGRLACLLIQVSDPLSLRAKSLPRLLIGSYVRVEITGRTLDSVIPVPRDYLHDGNTVWIMNSENRLEVRPVEILFQDKHQVYVGGGLEPAERLVVTNLGIPVEDMLLELASCPPGDISHSENPEEDSL